MHRLTRRTSALRAAVMACFVASASVPAARSLADIPGFTQAGAAPTDFTLNANANAVTAGVPTITAGSLLLTSNAASEATSAYYNTAQPLNNWTASFTYTLGTGGSNPPADGFAFVLQNAGTTALGANGGGLGYTGVTPSAAALTLDLYNGGNVANPTLVGTGRNGNIVDKVSSAPVSFRATTPLNVTLTYNDGVLTQTVVDPALAAGSNTFTRTLNRNFSNYMGVASTAFVGFSGGTGGAVAQQTISNFTFVTGNAPAVAAAGPLIGGVPQGGTGFFGVREVTNNNAVGTIAEAEASITTDRSGTRRVVDATTPSVDYFDSDIRGDFTNDRPYASAGGSGPAVGSVDNLALISSGTVRVPTAGYYTFAVRSDDGFRLTIGGQRFEAALGQGGTVINANGALEFPNGRGAGERSLGQIFLPAGDHPIQLLHWEGTGGASAELSSAAGQQGGFNFSYNLVGQVGGTAPRRAGNITAGGFTVRSFNGVASLADGITAYQAFVAGTRTADATATNVPTIFYSDPNGRGAQRSGVADFGNDRPFPNDTAADDNTFATAATGTLQITTAGRYTFDIYADDLTRFRLTDSAGNDVDLAGTAGNGSMGVNTDADAANDAYQTTGCCGDSFAYFDLAAGNYSLEMITNEGSGGASMSLFGAFGQYNYFDPAVFQLVGQNIDATSTHPDGLQLVAAVPEPGTLGGLAVGSLALLARRRRRA